MVRRARRVEPATSVAGVDRTLHQRCVYLRDTPVGLSVGLWSCSTLVISNSTRATSLDSQRKPRSVGAEVSMISRDCVNDQPRLVKPSAETDLEKISPANTHTPVGRPGLEPGTLGLKVPCSTR